MESKKCTEQDATNTYYKLYTLERMIMFMFKHMFSYRIGKFNEDRGRLNKFQLRKDSRSLRLYIDVETNNTFLSSFCVLLRY